MKTLLALALSILFGTCAACGNPPPPAPTPVHADGECAAAETQLRKVCPALAQTKKGIPFETVCKDAAAAGDPTIRSQATCIASSIGCDSAKACK